MENNIQIIPFDQEEESTSNFSFKSFVSRCLKGWYWFVISAGICCGLACFHILRTRPVFTRSATILIKEAASRRMTTSDIESVLSFSGGSMSSKVVNEVIAFQSPAIMQEVVSRLGLTTDYAMKSMFRSNVIYGVQVPFEAEFIDVPSNITLSFNVDKKGEDGFAISKFVYHLKNDKIKVAPFAGTFGDTLSTEIGRIVIKQSEYFTGEWKRTVIVRHLTLDGATAMYSSRFKAAPTDMKNKSDVLDIEIKDNSVQRADDIINTVINVYNESWVEDKNRMAVSTSEFIAERLISLEKELGDVDNDISDFKSRNLMPDLSTVSEMYKSQTELTERYIQELSNQQYIFRYIKTYLANNPGIESLIPAATSINSNAIASQIADYNKSLLNRNNIRSNSSELNPLVKDLNAALTQMRLAIEDAIDNQLETISAQMDNLFAQERKNNSRIAESPAQAKYLLSVGRQQKVKEALYLYLLQKREENELSQAFTAYNTRIITPPMGTARPTSPKKMQILLVALFLGLMIPLVIIYIIEASNTKIRSKNDLKSLTLPYLGEVPFHSFGKAKGIFARILGREKAGGAEIIVRPGKRDITNEAFRVIRTNLEFMERGHSCPVIISCSLNPGSGKTFLTANMSAALAIKGNRVLAIDGDLRRGSLSEYVGSPRKGISNYLAGDEKDIDSLIVTHKEIENFDVLPVGKIPPNPTELISQKEFPELIGKLREKYDYILIDCPPVDIVADARIIGECADRTVFVVRAGVLDFKDVANIQKAYDEKRFNNLCYIFNGVETSASYYGHYGSYGYGSKKNGYYSKHKRI
ncbi:MAG: polysaccharide biosynthesis tyrosine autokinase [Bacteroidales bacterium]|nr:polysaccharide biosynthesis tyrosine autokinase [Bacteroidales bacterium]